jgi:DNA-binding MarR family transcriptional regulator
MEKKATTGIIALIGSLREKYGRFLERELTAHGIEGLVPSHGSILSVLFRSEAGLPMGDIARMIGRTKSTVTQLVERLVALGFVEKTASARDGREVLVVLTNKGRGIKADFDEISVRLIETAYQGFSEKEKEELVGYLIRMWGNF